MQSNATRSTWNSGKGKQRSENKAFVLFIYLFKITKRKLNSDLENLISFSVIYRFIGLRQEITEICSIKDIPPKYSLLSDFGKSLYTCNSINVNPRNEIKRGVPTLPLEIGGKSPPL